MKNLISRPFVLLSASDCRLCPTWGKLVTTTHVSTHSAHGLLQAAGQLKTASLPELFCGFSRDERLGPVPPVACHPQAWSAAGIFMIVQAMLGIEVMRFDRKLVIDSPAMPDWLDWLKIENLKVGDGEVSLMVRRAQRALPSA